jgi:ferrochelatase
MANNGVLITGFGGPDSIESVRPFMRNLMGREPSDELVERVTRRYLTIGGSSPLTEIAFAIAEKLGDALVKLGAPMPVAVGMSYWNPTIAQAVAGLVELGCDRIITVSLSPFESKVSQGVCRTMAQEAASQAGGIEIVEAPLIGTLPEFVEYLAGSCSAALTDIEPSDSAIVAFTAHSLPESDLVENDPYVAGLERVAQSVAETMGMGIGFPGAGAPNLGEFRAFGTTEYPRAWFIAYQSKGQKPGTWLGPDLEELIAATAESPFKSIVVCPIGFWTDHMETLYDLDVVAASQALDSGLEFGRAQVPNDDDMIVEAVAKSIVAIA